MDLRSFSGRSHPWFHTWFIISQTIAECHSFSEKNYAFFRMLSMSVRSGMERMAPFFVVTR